MNLALWLLLFAGSSLFCLWVLRRGGAEWLAGWRAAFFIDWPQAPVWSAEQIKLAVLLTWLGHAVWFVAGLFEPGLRLAG